MAFKRMTITIQEELADKITQYNQQTRIAKSNIIAMALEQYFESKEIMNTMKDLSPLLEQIKLMTKAIEDKKNE